MFVAQYLLQKFSFVVHLLQNFVPRFQHGSLNSYFVGRNLFQHKVYDDNFLFDNTKRHTKPKHQPPLSFANSPTQFLLIGCKKFSIFFHGLINFRRKCTFNSYILGLFLFWSLMFFVFDKFWC